MPNDNWTVKDFEAMNISIVSVGRENGWIVLQLESGARLKFKSW